MTKLLIGILILFFSPVTLFANEVMFEGYYRIDLEGKQIGYAIVRHSFDSGKKTFQVDSYSRVKIADKMVQETTKAKSDDKFQPLSWNYTMQTGDQMKMIDGTVKGEVMTVKIADGKKAPDTKTYKIPKGTFFSNQVPYILMQKKLELNQAWKYSAIAEEDGSSAWGKAWLVQREAKPGIEVYSVMNKYLNEEYISKLAFVKDGKDAAKNVRAEVLSTSSPAKNLTQKLMASAQQATEGQMVPNKTLLNVFGGIPTGKINLVATPPEIEVGKGPKNTIASPVPAGEPLLDKLNEPPPKLEMPPETQPKEKKPGK